MVLMFFFPLFVWHQTIISKETDRTVLFLFSVGCSIGYVLLCAFSVRAGIALDGKYKMDDRSIQAAIGRMQVVLSTDQPMYMSRMEIIFHIRYGKWKYSYLAISANPIDGIVQEYAGISAVRQAVKRNMVIVPWDKTVQRWVKENWNKDTVSDYPKVMYFPGCDANAVTEK